MSFSGFVSYSYAEFTGVDLIALRFIRVLKSHAWDLKHIVDEVLGVK